MTVLDEHIAHHKHLANIYKEGFKDVKDITFHNNPNEEYDSNFWLNTITLDKELKVIGQENAYNEAIAGAVGGAAGVVHSTGKAHTDCEPNTNVETMRMVLDKLGIESRPLWKPMHLQPVYKNSPAYINGISEELFKTGLCLPSGPMISDEDARFIIESIKQSIVE